MSVESTPPAPVSPRAARTLASVREQLVALSDDDRAAVCNELRFDPALPLLGWEETAGRMAAERLLAVREHYKAAVAALAAEIVRRENPSAHARRNAKFLRLSREGSSETDIAETCGTSRDTVAAGLRRAREAERSVLARVLAANRGRGEGAGRLPTMFADGRIVFDDFLT
jgi:hypothetical protein